MTIARLENLKTGIPENVGRDLSNRRLVLDDKDDDGHFCTCRFDGARTDEARAGCPAIFHGSHETVSRFRAVSLLSTLLRSFERLNSS